MDLHPTVTQLREFLANEPNKKLTASTLRDYISLQGFTVS